ncbi:MAG: PorV/PorQ family protein, partial [Ignavibacteriaceae bacterium]
MKQFLYIILVNSVLFTSSVFAQFDFGFDFSKAGSAGLQSLKIESGARERSLGGAVSSIVNDANAIFWNVAGIGHVKAFQLFASHSNWLVDSKHITFAAAYPVGPVVVGLSVMSMQINDFEETTALDPQGTGRMVSAGDIAIGIGVARQFTDKLFIGGQIKYVKETLDDKSFDNFLFDIGTIYNTGWRNLRLGFALQHFGPDMKFINKTVRTPLLFRMSAADDIISSDNFLATLMIELVHPTDNNEWLNIGSEFVLVNALSLRAGYRFNNDEGNFSAGAGVHSPVLGLSNIKVDYAFTSYT